MLRVSTSEEAHEPRPEIIVIGPMPAAPISRIVEPPRPDSAAVETGFRQRQSIFELGHGPAGPHQLFAEVGDNDRGRP
jgi:hypothetical protein